MSDLTNDIIINSSKKILIQKQYDALNKLNLGFVVNDFCFLHLLAITTHCIENMHIFTKEQYNNINIILNKLS